MKPTRHTEPNSIVSRIADAMLESGRAHPEYEFGMQLIVCINANETVNEETEGVVAYNGFEKDEEMIAEMFVHLSAALATRGKILSVLSMEEMMGGQN
jgi:hypothetical protein